MRVAFMIPHCFLGQDAGSLHGSDQPRARQVRRHLLDRVIFQIHALFGATHHALNTMLSRPSTPDAESTLATYASPNPFHFDFEIHVFTARGAHLLGELQCGATHYRHAETGADPRFLGFECARWMRDNLASYDLFCFLEDDIILRDPLFFAKILSFNGAFDAGTRGIMVQPQRFEEALNAGEPAYLSKISKLYIDYQSQEKPAFAGEPLSLVFAGVRAEFEPALNPHAGCYVLDRAQAAKVIAHPDFLDAEKIFISPLDTAATGFVSRALKIYKPARNSLAFLEVQHGHQSILRQRFA